MVCCSVYVYNTNLSPECLWDLKTEIKNRGAAEVFIEALINAFNMRARFVYI